MKGFYFMCCTLDGQVFFARQLSAGAWYWEKDKRIATVFDSVDATHALQCKYHFRDLSSGYISGFISTDERKQQ